MVDLTVVASRRGRIGHLLLNRPNALNALDHSMIQLLGSALQEWRNDPAVHAVVIEGAGGKAFCAGGDVRAVRQAVLAGQHDAVRSFFAQEYALNQLIADYPKPYIAVIDGICMGGGIGMAVHGAVRIVTDAAVLAMPETGIALFPDVGTTFVLPRLRGSSGLYMALTGARLHGAEAVFTGLATHYVSREAVAALVDALAADGPAVLAEIAIVPPVVALAAQMEVIDRCFSAASVAGIIQRLESDGSDFALGALKAIRSASPSAVLWTFAIVSAGASRTLPQCLAAELALTAHVTRHHDFAEGVRAMVVDKDRAPKWSPASLADVSQAAISAMFEGVPSTTTV